MADNEEKDKDQKTEEPTSHRLEEAYKKGQIPLSREIVHWFVLFACAISSIYLLPKGLKKITNTIIPFFASAHVFTIDAINLKTIFFHLLTNVSLAVFFPIMVIIATVIIISLAQSSKAISLGKLKPKLEHISFMKGVKRLFSKNTVVEFLKAFFKFLILSIAIFVILKSKSTDFYLWLGMSVEQFLILFSQVISQLFTVVLIIFAFIAGFDFWFQRYSFMQNMRMTKQEVKDEMKDMDGDPKIKQRIRQIRQENMKKAMLQSVPQATIVIANPTHFAVALRWEEEDMDAPIVIAKGQDYIALKIREIATSHKIPIIENPPLARSLYGSVEIEQEILPEHYQMVAEIIRTVMLIRKQQF